MESGESQRKAVGRAAREVSNFDANYDASALAEEVHAHIDAANAFNQEDCESGAEAHDRYFDR